MGMKPRIKLTLVEKRGDSGCHRGHKIGDVFDYDTDRGKLCPMAMHVAFPYIDILRYGGMPPKAKNGEIRFCCPDSDVINVFKIEVEDAT
ncbi:MAG: TIGR04076 family protein [Oscillibacter sp.]|nr:TIGR04076 family protein [Oscillibacter sp.]